MKHYQRDMQSGSLAGPNFPSWLLVWVPILIGESGTPLLLDPSNGVFGQCNQAILLTHLNSGLFDTCYLLLCNIHELPGSLEVGCLPGHSSLQKVVVCQADAAQRTPSPYLQKKRCLRSANAWHFLRNSRARALPESEGKWGAAGALLLLVSILVLYCNLGRAELTYSALL